MKNWIASMLLVFYGLSMVHAMIPHYGSTDVFGTTTHEHEHRQDSSQELKNSDGYIYHEDHLEGFYDLLLCILDDIDHHDHEATSNLHLGNEQSAALVVLHTPLEVFLEPINCGFQPAAVQKTHGRWAPLSDPRGPPALA